VDNDDPDKGFVENFQVRQESPSPMSRYIVCRVQSISINFFFLSSTNTSEFNLWIMNFKKQYKFIQFKILERYIKLENRNYIID
jgi:hypothetical protein